MTANSLLLYGHILGRKQAPINQISYFILFDLAKSITILPFS